MRDIEECGECSIVDNFGVVIKPLGDDFCDDLGSTGLNFTSCKADVSITYKSYYYQDETYKYKDIYDYQLSWCQGDKCYSQSITCGLEYWGDYSYEDCELRTELHPNQCRQFGKDQEDCRNSVFFEDPCYFLPYEDSVDTGFENFCRDIVHYDGSSEAFREYRGNLASTIIASFAVLISGILITI